MTPLWLTLRQTARVIRSHRKLWLPFLVVAAVEVLFLGLVWLAPHAPFSAVLAPPLRYFFGDRILHYPWHLWFLYHVMKHTHVAASILIGAFMTGVACAMVRQLHKGQPFSLRDALIEKQVRYGTTVLLWLITWSLARGLGEACSRWAPKSVWSLWGIVILTVLLQALLGYAIPASVFAGSSWWKSLLQSVREALRYPWSTLMVVTIPSVVLIAFVALVPPARVFTWMSRWTPECVLLLVVGRLVLWTVADVFTTVALAHLWWNHRTQLEKGHAVA